jgi:hypothetical protein
MARLALLAILLLALLPTLGRLAQARAAGTAAAPAWAALCTMRGLQRVALAPAAGGVTHAIHDRARATGEAPAPPHGAADGTCGYCPLLAMAVPVAIAPIAVPPESLPPALCTSRPLPSRGQPHPCGLGSRGPPSTS